MKQIVFLVILVVIVSAGCAGDKIDPIQETASAVAAADYQMDFLTISGDEYIEMTAGKLAQRAKFLTRQVTYSEGERYSIQDLSEMSDDQFSDLRELAGYDPGCISSLKVSKLYDDPDFSFKYLFTQYSVDVTHNRILHTKRYTLVEENGEWLVLSSVGDSALEENPPEIDHVLRYTTYGDDVVEYVQEISLYE